MPRRWPLVLGLLVALVAIWWVAAPRPHDETAAPVPPAVAPLADTPPASGGTDAPRPPPSAAAPPLPPPPPPPPSAAANPVDPNAAVAIEAFPPPKTEGPVEQYKAAFQSEPRDSGAQSDETAAEGAFRAAEVPAALFKSALCHQSICRIEVRWTKDRQIAYMTSFTRLLAAVGQKTAVEAASGPDQSGEYPLTLWVQRGDRLEVPQQP